MLNHSHSRHFVRAWALALGQCVTSEQCVRQPNSVLLSLIGTVATTYMVQEYKVFSDIRSIFNWSDSEPVTLSMYNVLTR